MYDLLCCIHLIYMITHVHVRSPLLYLADSFRLSMILSLTVSDVQILCFYKIIPFIYASDICQLCTIYKLVTH